MVQALVDAASLVGMRGAYRLAVDVATIRMPSSVHDILAARIDRLPEREKRVLETAAVIGQAFTEPILATVAELPPAEVRAALGTLQAAELVYEQSPFPVAEHAFKHALTREVALRSQLQERRRRLHAATARAIAAAHPDKLDEQAALVAHHWEEADEPLGAGTWLARAAQWLVRRDFAAAARHVAHALDLVRRRPEAVEAAALGARLAGERLALGFRVGLTMEEAERVFEEGLAWAARLDDPMVAARMHQAMAVLCSFDLRLEPALRHAAEWERAAAVSLDAEIRSYAKWPALLGLRLSGDLSAARRAVQWQLAATADRPTWGLRDWAMSAQANALIELAWIGLLGGDLKQARSQAERGIDVARTVGDLENQWAGLMVLTVVAFHAGDPVASRPMVQRLVEIGERLGSDFVRSDSQFRLGVQRLLEDDAAGAIEIFESEGLALVTRSPTAPVVAMYRAESLRRLGDTRRARLVAAEAYDFVKQRRLLVSQAEGGIVLARIVRADGGAAEGDRITALLDEVDAIVATTGARLFTPFVLVERAELAGLEGDAARRRRQLREASDLFAAMGATGQVRRLGKSPV